MWGPVPISAHKKVLKFFGHISHAYIFFSKITFVPIQWAYRIKTTKVCSIKVKSHLYCLALHLAPKFVLYEVPFRSSLTRLYTLFCACIVIGVGLYCIYSFIQCILEIFLGKRKRLFVSGCIEIRIKVELEFLRLCWRLFSFLNFCRYSAAANSFQYFCRPDSWKKP